MKRILCALLVLLTVLILPSCSSNVPQGNEESTGSPEQSSSKAETQIAENSFTKNAHYDVDYLHPILGDLLGTVSVDIEYSYDFATSKITDYKIKSEMEEGYSSSVLVDKNQNSIDVVMTCTEDESGEVLCVHKCRYMAMEDGNTYNTFIPEENQR